MTTEIAFKLMIHTRGISKTLGLAPGTVRRLRYNHKSRGGISLDKKYEYLQRAGFVKTQEVNWIVKR